MLDQQSVRSKYTRMFTDSAPGEVAPFDHFRTVCDIFFYPPMICWALVGKGYEKVVDDDVTASQEFMKTPCVRHRPRIYIVVVFIDLFDRFDVAPIERPPISP